jgi:ATP-dependent Clp protease ATP-binding subunit ClpA
VREGYDPVYGARPLRRTIQRRIENELARRILAGEFREGQKVVVDFADGEFRFSAVDATPAGAGSGRDGDIVEGEVIEAV